MPYSSVRNFHPLRFLTHVILISRQEARHFGMGHPAPKRILQEQQVRRQPILVSALLYHPQVHRLEGIVSKRKGSRYRSGRSPDWLKMKNPDAPAVKREAEEELGERAMAVSHCSARDDDTSALLPGGIFWGLFDLPPVELAALAVLAVAVVVGLIAVFSRGP
jgi:hypothetical protein